LDEAQIDLYGGRTIDREVGICGDRLAQRGAKRLSGAHGQGAIENEATGSSNVLCHQHAP
jgi:hypothetical protein